MGAVGIALSGRLFRLARHLDEGRAGAHVLLDVLVALTSPALDWFFSSHARGSSSVSDDAAAAEV